MHGLLRQLCDRHQPAVLLVTHDVDEAISLADRVLVLEEGRIVSDIAIDLPEPREHGDPRFRAHPHRSARHARRPLSQSERHSS